VHSLACKEGKIELVPNMVKFILIFLIISQGIQRYTLFFSLSSDIEE
jgi:hypothetical protein